jgi:hypothetical protein
MPGVALRLEIEPKPIGATNMKQSQAAIFTAFLLLTSAPTYAMCGGGGMDMGTSKGKATGGMQCGGGMKMDAMDMGAKASPDTTSPGAKAADPHAGMDMGDAKGDAKKAGGCCCGCCGSSADGKSGSMCGKQAAATVDGKNDPLLNDPMWKKEKTTPQSHAPVAP